MKDYKSQDIAKKQMHKPRGVAYTALTPQRLNKFKSMVLIDKILGKEEAKRHRHIKRHNL